MVAHTLRAEEGSTRPTEGLHTSTTSVHALIVHGWWWNQDGRSKTERSSCAMVLYAAIGTNVPIPVEARRWQFDSHVTIYPGLIDATTPSPQHLSDRDLSLGTLWLPPKSMSPIWESWMKANKNSGEIWDSRVATWRRRGEIISGWWPWSPQVPGSWHETLLVAEAPSMST